MKLNKLYMLFFSLSLISPIIKAAEPEEKKEEANKQLMDNIYRKCSELDRSLNIIVSSLVNAEKMIEMSDTDSDSLYQLIRDAENKYRAIQTEQIKAEFKQKIGDLNKKIDAVGLGAITENGSITSRLMKQLEQYYKDIGTTIDHLNKLKKTFDEYLLQGVHKDGYRGEGMIESSDRNLLKELRVFFEIILTQLAAKRYQLNKIVGPMDSKIAEGQMDAVLKALVSISNSCAQLKVPGTLENELSLQKSSVAQERTKAQAIIQQLWQLSAEQLHITRNLHTLFAVLNGKNFLIPNQGALEQNLFSNLMKSNLRNLAFDTIMSGWNNFILVRNKTDSQQISSGAKSWGDWGWGFLGKATKYVSGMNLTELPNLDDLLRKCYSEQDDFASQQSDRKPTEKDKVDIAPETVEAMRNKIDKVCPEMPSRVFNYFAQDHLPDVIPTSFDDFYTNAIIKTRNMDVLLYDIASRTRFRTGRLSFLIRPLIRSIEESVGCKYDSVMNKLKDPSTPLDKPWVMFRMPPLLVKVMERLVLASNPDRYSDVIKKMEQENTDSKKTDGTKKTDSDSSKYNGMFGFIVKRAVRLKDRVIGGAKSVCNFTKNIMCKAIGKRATKFLNDKFSSVYGFGSHYISRVKTLAARATLTVIRQFAKKPIAELEKSLSKGQRPSVLLEKIQTFISDYELEVFRGPISAILKRNHQNLRALAEKYYDLQRVDPLDLQTDPQDSSTKTYTIKDEHIRRTMKQISDQWFNVKKALKNERNEKQKCEEKLTVEAKAKKLAEEQALLNKCLVKNFGDMPKLKEIVKKPLEERSEELKQLQVIQMVKEPLEERQREFDKLKIEIKDQENKQVKDEKNLQDLRNQAMLAPNLSNPFVNIVKDSLRQLQLKPEDLAATVMLK